MDQSQGQIQSCDNNKNEEEGCGGKTLQKQQNKQNSYLRDLETIKNDKTYINRLV